MIFKFGKGGIPSGAQGLFLALHSGITPGGAQETEWDASIEPGLTMYKSRVCSIYLAPVLIFKVKKLLFICMYVSIITSKIKRERSLICELNILKEKSDLSVHEN